MEKQDIYEKLGKHLSLLGMGYPYTEALIEILRQNYTELEAKVALAIPTKVIPLEPVGIDEIQKGIAKELSKQEALEKIKETEEAGLVHFVDNAKGDIRHNCNCCGCACWNVGNISRRKIPRDVIMETYFIRETDRDRCTGCGACAEICPVRTVELKDDFPLTDEEWCIGCGVCSTVCPSDAAKMKLRPDKTGEIQANNFRELQEKILEEKGLK